MKIVFLFTGGISPRSCLMLIEIPILAGIPGGGAGLGPRCNLTGNGNTVTIANGTNTKA
jgi:hypothetical protein